MKFILSHPVPPCGWRPDKCPMFNTPRDRHNLVTPKSCGIDDFTCNNGACIEGFRRCDGAVDCSEGEDEVNCECREDQFRCRSGSCIELRKRCDGYEHCSDRSDEENCNGTLSCPPEKFACSPTSSVPCAIRCNGFPECDGNEDEDNCPDEECSHQCDGKCLPDANICDSITDCSDGSDELHCAQCDGPDDYRCDTDECISRNWVCNGHFECPNGEDEADCNSTIVSTPISYSAESIGDNTSSGTGSYNDEVKLSLLFGLWRSPLPAGLTEESNQQVQVHVPKRTARS